MGILQIPRRLLSPGVAGAREVIELEMDMRAPRRGKRSAAADSPRSGEGVMSGADLDDCAILFYATQFGAVVLLE